MGCDIHIIIQEKVDGKWKDQDYGIEYEGRNYELFAFLHDVRNIRFNIEPYSVTNDRNGLPSDLNINDYDYWLQELHNVFWVHLSELTDMSIYNQEIECYGKLQTVKEEMGEDWFKYLQELEDLDTDIRLIVGFDN